MTSEHRLSRRALLRAAGAGAALLPLMHTERGLGQAMTFPKRLVIVFSPNGSVPESFWPTDTPTPGTGSTPAVANLTAPLPTITSPLEPFKSRLTFVRGLAVASHQYDQNTHNTDGAHSALASLLTGVPSVLATTSSGDHPDIAGASAPSVDQFIAAALEATDPRQYRSLVLAVKPASASFASSQTRLSWRGRLSPVTPENNPYNLFADMFAASGMSTPDAARRLRNRRSVLDGTARDLTGLLARLGGRDDQLRLAAHLDAVHQLEQRLMPAPGTCTPPMLGGPYSPDDYAHVPDVGRAQMDLLVTALTCGITRVSTLMWNDGTGLNLVFPWLSDWASTSCPTDSGVCPDDSSHIGGQLGHHAVSHAWGNGVEPWKTYKTHAEQWLAQQFAYLLGRLDAVPEGSGTLLDHTAVVWVNNMEYGASHSMDNVPFVIAGGCSGALRTGRSLWYGAQQPMNRMLTTLVNAFGVDASGFGTDQFDSRAIPELLAG